MKTSPPPNTKSWSRENLAWAAGFIDGEGAIGLYKAGKRVTGEQIYHSAISVPQNSPELLLRLQNLFGGIVSQGKTRKIHRWRINVRGFIYPVLVALYPWFSIKRKQETERVIHWFKTNPHHFNTRI